MTTRENILDFKKNQKVGNYTIISKDNSSNPLVEPLGEGGSGIVYLAERSFTSKVSIKRAIKFYIYRDDIISDKEEDSRVSVENFEDEILNICSFNHENIIKIIDGGIEERNELKIPFIVTEYIDGYSLDKIIENPQIARQYINSDKEIIDIFCQICSGIRFLHNNKFYHCDIAPKNIYLKGEQGRFQVIIGDLASGRTLDNTKKNENNLFLQGSSSYMPENIMLFNNKEIQYEEFIKLQPSWDLYSLKTTFKELINSFEKIVDSGSTWFRSLKKIIGRDYNEVSDLADNIERLKPIYRQTAGVPELSEADTTLHGHYELHPIRPVWVTDRVKKIIRHPLFFRLKKVPQLLSSNTFNPGSNHTRYEHALGSYENMRKVLMTLLRNDDFLALFDGHNIEIALISSLLSSISKFPLSFIIHEIRMSDDNLFEQFSTKEYISKILEFKDESKNINYSLKDTIEKEFKITDFDQLLEIIKGDLDTSWDKNTVLISKLLHSTIDVRVLDFLTRDSYHLGISSGTHIDFDSLISSICIHNKEFAIKSRGVTYVEQVVSLRYWLYKRIYWNSPNRAYTSVLKYVIINLQLKDNAFQNRLFNVSLFADNTQLLDFIQSETIDNCELPIRNLFKTIHSERPAFFKEIFVINKSESADSMNNICETISQLNHIEVEKVRVELENELSKILIFDENHVNILIDIPNERIDKIGEDITVIKNDGKPVMISELSGLIKGINDTFDKNLKFLRIYLNPIYKDQLKLQNKRREVNDFIRDFIVKKYGL